MECEPLERVLYKQFVTDADNMRLERGGTVTPIHEKSAIPRLRAWGLAGHNTTNKDHSYSGEALHAFEPWPHDIWTWNKPYDDRQISRAMHQCGTTASLYHPLCLRMFVVGVYVCAKSCQNGWSLSFGWSPWATMGNPAIPRVWPIGPRNDRFFGGTTILLSRD